MQNTLKSRSVEAVFLPAGAEKEKEMSKERGASLQPHG